jgi:2-hydroxy-6-oxonona-2,4-dienedioate hydrolase
VTATDLGTAAAAWASTNRVQVGSRRVRYRDAGDGPAIVLVHGLAMAADYWSRTGPPLAAAGFRVLAPDLPGFGETDGPADGLGIPEQASALRRWAEALGVGPAVYVGHSLSCQTILELAAFRPAAVTGLVLAAPTGDGGERRMVAEAARLFLDAWRESLQLLVLAGHAYLRAGPRRFFGTWKSGAAHDPLSLLPKIHVPVLVVVGGIDPVAPLSFAAEIVGSLADGRLEVIPGGTHAVFFAEPYRFNSAVVEFARGLSRAVG